MNKFIIKFINNEQILATQSGNLRKVLLDISIITVKVLRQLDVSLGVTETIKN